MSEHIHDGRSHCPACALEKIGWQKQEIADLEAENARLQTRVEERERCGDCADSPEDIRLPARYRCYFCDKQFCGPHAKTHFKEGRKTATALAETERERDRYKALAERRGRAGLFLWWFIGVTDTGDIDHGDVVRRYGAAARAALAATPEEVGEKERR